MDLNEILQAASFLKSVTQSNGSEKANEKQHKNAFEKHIGQYCVVRSYADGVHLAVINEVYEGISGFSVSLSNGRRLHGWKGALCLHEVADKGIDFKNSRLSDVKIGNYSVANVIGIFPIVNKGLAEEFKNAKSHVSN